MGSCWQPLGVTEHLHGARADPGATAYRIAHATPFEQGTDHADSEGDEAGQAQGRGAPGLGPRRRADGLRRRLGPGSCGLHAGAEMGWKATDLDLCRRTDPVPMRAPDTRPSKIFGPAITRHGAVQSWPEL